MIESYEAMLAPEDDPYKWIITGYEDTIQAWESSNQIFIVDFLRNLFERGKSDISARETLINSIDLLLKMTSIYPFMYFIPDWSSAFNVLTENVLTRKTIPVDRI